MLSIKNVLPNFSKTLIVAAAAMLSVNAFASDAHIKDANDISAEETLKHDGKAIIPEGHKLTLEEIDAKEKLNSEINDKPKKVPYE